MATLLQKAVLGLAFLCLTGLGSSAAAEVKILFLPPPMAGTISFGIYDSTGKLVRVLHKEAEVGEFTAALNGLVTTWDGNDDEGAACPPGTYHARGFMVGDLDVEGVDFHGNDWVTEDDSPRISRITDIATKDDALYLKAKAPGQPEQAESTYLVSLSGTQGDTEPRLLPAPDAFPKAVRPSVPFMAIAPETVIAAGRNGAVWSINGASVQETSTAGVMHTIAAKPSDPVPVKIAASRSSDKIYILEENSAEQRLRGLEFTGTAAEPTVFLEKILLFSDRFDQVASRLTFPDGKPFVSSSTLTLSLIQNPLFQNKPGKLEVTIAVDEKGSFLETPDGLPLYRVSETPHLRWAALGRPEGVDAVTIFESDGAVISEFKAEHLGRMMAFDAGEIQLAPASASPSPAAKQDGEGVPSPTATPQGSPSAVPQASPQAAPQVTPQSTP